MEFNIKKNATLPILKVEICKDGRSDFNLNSFLNSGSTFYISLFDKTIDKILFASKECYVTSKFSEFEGKTLYYLNYQFTNKDTLKIGKYEVQISVTSDNGVIILPLQEKFYVNIVDSFSADNISFTDAYSMNLPCCGFQETFDIGGLNLEAYYYSGSLIIDYILTSTNTYGTDIRVDFTNELEVFTGSTIQISTGVTITAGQNRGTTQVIYSSFDFDNLTQSSILSSVEFTESVQNVILNFESDVIFNTPPPSLTPTNTPTSTVTTTLTPSVTTTNTQTPTGSATPTMTETPTNTPTPTVTETPTNTPTPTNTDTPTNTPTTTPTITPTETTTPTPSVTETPTNTPTETVTPTMTETPTNTPTPTESETPTPTPTNTETPTNTPTMTETPQVIESPTPTPTETVTPTITETPTNTPTNTITITPTMTETPTNTPSETPTNTPTPSITPTNTVTPTVTPTSGATPSCPYEVGYFNTLGNVMRFDYYVNDNQIYVVTTGGTEVYDTSYSYIQTIPNSFTAGTPTFASIVFVSEFVYMGGDVNNKSIDIYDTINLTANTVNIGTSVLEMSVDRTGSHVGFTIDTDDYQQILVSTQLVNATLDVSGVTGGDISLSRLDDLFWIVSTGDTIVKVDASTKNIVSTLTVPNGGYSGYEKRLLDDPTNAYTYLLVDGGRLFVYDSPSTPTYYFDLTQYSGTNTSMIIDEVNNKLYILNVQSPDIFGLIKIDIGTLSDEGLFNLGTTGFNNGYLVYEPNNSEILLSFIPYANRIYRFCT
jgi:hypothetical protein